MSTITHMPRLDTIKMVESALKKQKRYLSKNQLWRKLPKQVQYPTFKKILEYLEESNKIIYDQDGTIVWVFADNARLKKLVKQSVKLR